MNPIWVKNGIVAALSKAREGATRRALRAESAPTLLTTVKCGATARSGEGQKGLFWVREGPRQKVFDGGQSFLGLRGVGLEDETVLRPLDG